MANRFIGAVKKGITGVQAAYTREVKAAEVRARVKTRNAETRYKKEQVKAELEQKKLVLQRQMYEAKAAVKMEKEAVVRARHAAGVRTVGEQLSSVGKSLSRDAMSAYRGLTKTSKPKRRTTRRR